MLNTICLYGIFPHIHSNINFFLFVKRGDNQNLSKPYQIKQKQIVRTINYAFIVFKFDMQHCRHRQPFSIF
jgi:hypothetical protein